MPDITFLGWIHTILGISAISVGIYEIIKNKYFTINSSISQVYFWPKIDLRDATVDSKVFIFNDFVNSNRYCRYTQYGMDPS